MSGSDLPHAFSANQFCRHDQLLWREIRFLDSADGKLSEMYAQFLRKLAHRRQPRMQDFTNCVIEAGNADIIRNSDSRLLERLVHTRGSLIGPDEKRAGPLPDNVVSNQRKRNLLFREGRKNIGGMSAAQDDSAGPVRGCQGLGKAQTAQRRTQIGAKRDEMERPVLARTVSLGSQQDLGLE